MKQKHAKKLEELMALKYKTQIDPIPMEDGGGYVAYHPELGSNIILGDGDTEEEALRNLAQVKKEWFEIYLNRGIPIPTPNQDEPLEKYSGRFVLRTSRSLHRVLSTQARANGVSLNSWITQLLSSAVTGVHYEAQLDKCMSRFQNGLWNAIQAGALYTISESPPVTSAVAHLVPFTGMNERGKAA